MFVLSRLQGKHMSQDGKSVDYEALKKDDLFRDFTELAKQLIACNPFVLSEGGRRAFFISMLRNNHSLCCNTDTRSFDRHLQCPDCPWPLFNRPDPIVSH